MEDNELWTYDEPHESGGNCRVTMTRRQAIDYECRVRPGLHGRNEDEIFLDWVAAHWAHRCASGKSDSALKPAAV